MNGRCPHCHTTLSGMGDAFCSQCFGSLTDEPSQPSAQQTTYVTPARTVPPEEVTPLLARFSLPARLVIVGSILGAASGTVAYTTWLTSGLPGGSYPLWFFMLPVFAGGALLCAAGLRLLRWLGVPLYRQVNQSNKAEDPPS